MIAEVSSHATFLRELPGGRFVTSPLDRECKSAYAPIIACAFNATP